MKDIVSIIGFLAVGYIFFAMYGKNNQPLHITDNAATLMQPDIAEARVYDAAAERPLERPLERPNEVSRRQRRTNSDDNRQLAVVTPAAPARNSAKASASQIRRSLDQLADLAVTSALDNKNLVPAGASLTLLIMGAEKGKQLTESNLQKVIHLLRSTKQDAPKEDLRNFFKYASNSEKWFEGLQLDHNGGYNLGDLLRIYDQYNLRRYDQDVLAMVSGSKMKFDKTYAPAIVAPAIKGEASNAEVRRNHAFAKNRWVEKAAGGTEADVKFVAAPQKDAASTTALRRKVAALQVGESLSFSKPDDYHAALKELLALENGYDSWKAYETGMGKTQAQRAFRKRSEKGSFFASGGLKITRQH
jgi:hypothetical protein